MTPYQLEEVVRKAKGAEWPIDRSVYELLIALVQHAADKEAEHNIEKAGQPR